MGADQSKPTPPIQVVKRQPAIKDGRPEWNLQTFMQYLDGENCNFEGLKLEDALHMLYANARILGDLGTTDKILERFAARYIEFNQGRAVHGFACEDLTTTHVLCFSIDLLNHDLHDPKVLRKMSKEQFRQNLRGMNQGNDFPASVLNDIYDSIKKCPLGIAKRELVRDEAACTMTKSAVQFKAEESLDDQKQRIALEDHRPIFGRADFQRVLLQNDDGGSCNLEGLDVLDALHLLLSHGKLHAEAQIVRLIVSDFADKYYEVNKERNINGMEFTNAVDVYTVCLAVIALDAEQDKHEQTKRKKTRDEFTRNLREFPKDYIHSIYDTIRQYPLGVAKRDLVRHSSAAKK